MSETTGPAGTTGPNGTALTLAAGDYRATVLTAGAGLGRLTWRGQDVVVPVPDGELAPAYLGKTLVPWPNRIADGRYAFDGVTHELPINEHATNSALHGLGCWVDWEVAHAGPAEATLRTTLLPRYGYPFRLRLEVTYRLTADAGLEVVIGSTNIGTTRAPYGSSAHPYLSCALAPVDECTLQVPAAQVMTVDERLLPLGTLAVAEAGLDFRQGPPLAGRQVDHAFTGLPPGGWEVVLAHPGSGLGVRLTAHAPWVQIYSGEKVGRRGVAVEPMTCPPDAFNSGTELVVLEPGQGHALSFRIEGLALPTAVGDTSS